MQISDEILGWFWGVGTLEEKGVRGSSLETFDSLEGLGSCSNSNVGSLELFREETESGVLLILLLGGNFPDQMRTSRKSGSKSWITSNTSTKSIFRFPS